MANVLADDGTFKLRFVNGRYQAGCRNFTREAAIAHWTKNAAKKGTCLAPEDKIAGCRCGVEVRKRARLFLKAIKSHKPEVTA